MLSCVDRQPSDSAHVICLIVGCFPVVIFMHGDWQKYLWGEDSFVGQVIVGNGTSGDCCQISMSPAEVYV